MNTYTAFMLLQARLNGIAKVFQYTGQYLPSKSKTHYKVPALYIEFLPNPEIVNFGKIRCLTYQIKLHYTAQAPYNATNNQTQQDAMLAYSTTMQELYNLMEGLEINDSDGRLVIGQCLITNQSPVSYQDTLAVGSISFQAKLYDYSAAYRITAPNAN